MYTKNSIIVEFDSTKVFFNLAPFPMWVYDIETLEFKSVNQEAILQYGYTEKEFLEMTIADIKAAEDTFELEEAIDVTNIKYDDDIQLGILHRKKDGNVLHVQVKSKIIHFEGRNAKLEVAIDLTEKYKQINSSDEKIQILETIGSINEVLLKSHDSTQALEECVQILSKFFHGYKISFYHELNGNLNLPSNPKWCENEKLCNGDTELRTLLFNDFPHLLQSLQKGDLLEIDTLNLPPSRAKMILGQLDIQTHLEFPLMINTIFSGSLILEDYGRKRKLKGSETQLLKTFISNIEHFIEDLQISKQLVEKEYRYRMLVEQGNDLIAIIGSKGDYIYVAPTSLKVLGIPAEEFVGKSAFEYIHKDDVPRVMKNLEQLSTVDQLSIEPYRFKDGIGNWRWVQTDLTNHCSNPLIAGIVANTKEVTLAVEKRMGEQLLASLTRSLSQPGSLSVCLAKALKVVLSLPEVSISEVWLLSEGKSRLNLISKSCKSENLEAFYNDSLNFNSVERGVGLPGNVWDIQKVKVIENLKEDSEFLRTKSAELMDLNTAMGIPIMVNDTFLGSLICFSTCHKKDLLTQVKLLTDVGLQIGTVLKQKITEDLYRNFFNISPGPHGIVGFDGYLKKVNNAFANLLGYDKSEIINKSIFQYLHEDDKFIAQEKVKDLIHGGISDSLESRFLTKDGKVKWFVSNGVVMQESKIIMVAAKDITEQKEASVELCTAYKKLKVAQKIAKLGYWAHYFSSDISEWSEETYLIHGYSPGEFVPTLENVRQTIHPEDRYLLDDDTNNDLEPGEIKSFEHRIITATDDIKWVCQETRILEDENQVIIGLEGTIQDITERKEYELQLVISNERFELAMKATNEMIWEIDHKTNIIYRSSRYSDIVNYKIKEKFDIENSWLGRVPLQKIEEVWCSFQETLDNKDINFWSNEYKILTDVGKVAYFVDRCFILRDINGKPLRSVGSVLDVTASREQLETIMQQNNNFREIAWLQSHVIRAPLSRIMSLLYLSKELEGGGKSIEEIFELISASVDEMDKVILEVIHKTEGIVH